MDPQPIIATGIEEGTEVGRTARKRRAILAAATEVFLQNGYLGASMDEVAAKAAVSKQTVYKQFEDKEHLFAEIVLGATDRVADEFVQSCVASLDQATDARQGLHELGQAFLTNLMRPDVLRLRRLIMAEADRFPQTCGAWFERGFQQTLLRIGEAMRRLAERGLLGELPDPTLVAYHFAGLLMYKPMNQVMFAGTQAAPDAAELDVLCERAADVFLAAYA